MSHKISSRGFLAFECFHGEGQIQNGVGQSGVFLFLENNSHAPESVFAGILQALLFCRDNLDGIPLPEVKIRRGKHGRIRGTISGCFIIVCYRMIYIMDKIYAKNSFLEMLKKVAAFFHSLHEHSYSYLKGFPLKNFSSCIYRVSFWFLRRC